MEKHFLSHKEAKELKSFKVQVEKPGGFVAKGALEYTLHPTWWLMVVI